MKQHAIYSGNVKLMRHSFYNNIVAHIEMVEQHPRLSNTRNVTTSVVKHFCVETGLVETNNTIYLPNTKKEFNLDPGYYTVNDVRYEYDKRYTEQD